MEPKEKLRKTTRAFYEAINNSIAPRFIAAYNCEMNCYENSKDIEKSDACATECRGASTKLRDYLQSEYSTIFVKYNQNTLSTGLQNCGKNETCIQNTLNSYESSLSQLLKALDSL